jgi:hypothetical protein
MTPEEVEEYGKRVEAMVKKEPAYPGWGFFYYKSIYKNKEDLHPWEQITKISQKLKTLQRLV